MSEAAQSRRNFFASVGRILIHRANEAPLAVEEPKRTFLGRVRDFPPGRTQAFPRLGLEVRSTEHGLAAWCVVERQYFGLRLDSRGGIWLERETIWDPNAVLCLMTGEKKTI